MGQQRKLMTGLFFLGFMVLQSSGVVINRPIETLNFSSEMEKTFESDSEKISASVNEGRIGDTDRVKVTKLVWTAEDGKWPDEGLGPSRLRKFGSIFDNMDCFGCNAAIYFVQNIIKTVGALDDKTGRTLVREAIITGCKARLNSEVCNGLVEEFVPSLYYILKTTKMGAKETCSFIMSNECEYVPDSEYEWNVRFPRIPKPAVVDLTTPKTGVKRLKVLQLSDIHYDPYYQEGANANCGNPLCCRSSNGEPQNPRDRAGKWGDYRGCDTPKRTLDHMLKHIQTIHSDIDYILWTGDLPPHDIWNQTREGNLQVLRDIMDDLKIAFPNVTIFPALGNHESAPVNSFPTKYVPSEYNIFWLYDELDKQWQRWLPRGASGTVKRGAFYSVLVRPAFRIISVNTNYCNDKNFWLLINSTDPADELQWLIDELQGAENRSEKVHIIGHMPPGTSECLKVWSANYYRIINRYESTIAAQFFGHTHYDEFELFYDMKNITRPVSVAYVGPSVTPYDRLNPGYRIYYIDDDEASPSRQVIDHETWIMDLEKANARGFPTWRKLYNAKRAYGMQSLQPRDWDALLDKMIDNPNIFYLYYRFYYKDSPVRPQCDINCRQQLLCDIRSGRSRDREVLCPNLQQKLQEVPHKKIRN
uniref:Sphingomyelin phosphodiesterase n=1 Tax=Fopius arisanus TaxID=64838 RepID=A0A0C9R6Z6_9HYME